MQQIVIIYNTLRKIEEFGGAGRLLRVIIPEKSPTISDKNLEFWGQRTKIPEIVPTISDFFPEKSAVLGWG